MHTPLGGIQPPPTSVDPLELEIRNATQGSITPDIKTQSATFHHFIGGQLALARDDAEDAMRHFSEVDRLTKEPAPLVHSKLAELYVREGRTEEALGLAEKAMHEAPDDPAMELLYAGILEVMGRSEQAIPVYKSVIERYPAKVEALVLLAHTYSKQGKLDDAAHILEELVQRDPKGSIGHFYLGQVYEQQRKFDKAEGEYLQVFEADETLTRAAPELLRVVLQQKKSQQARNLCERILEKNPNHVIARRVLGNLLLSESDLDGALQHLTVLQGLEQDASDTRFKIALIYLERRNLKEAERELVLVVGKNPKHAEARYYLASVYGATDRRQEAVAELLAIEPGADVYIRARTLAATLLKQSGKIGQANSILEEVYAREPHDRHVVLAYVLLLREMRELSRARRVLTQALEEHPDDEALLLSLGLILHESERTTEALEVMERMVVKFPHNVDALNYVAYSLAEKGEELGRAEELAKRAQQNRPDDGFVADTLGWIQFRQGRFPEATETLQRAAVLSGNDIVVVEHYAAALLGQGDRVRAVAVIKGALQRSARPPLEVAAAVGEEREASRERLIRTLEEVLRQSPELAAVKPVVEEGAGSGLVEKVSTTDERQPGSK